MRVVYHSAVQSDLDRAMRFYYGVSPSNAERFWIEFKETIAKITQNPQRFHFAAPDLRRANFERFPHYVLYQTIAGRIFVTAVRHDKQNPTTALRRRG